MSVYTSWGRFPKVEQKARAVHWRHEPLPQIQGTFLAYGMGRSYGDSCLNGGGTVLVTQSLNRLIAFDRERGTLTCEAGVTLAEILEFVVPLGWFLPVTPGTKFISVGGAIANDVHGKNHHVAGSFGNHVLQLELLRSDGSRVMCSPGTHPEWFAATVGGLGLTGLITWAEIQLKPIMNPFIAQDAVQFGGVDDFYALSEDSEKSFEYTVAWVDCLAQGKALGRGIFYRGNSAPAQVPSLKSPGKGLPLGVPFQMPPKVLNPLTMNLFNQLYYHKQRSRIVSSVVHFDPFFYPLDKIKNWNRIYGSRGFLQYQLVVPNDDTGRSAIREILKSTSKNGVGTFLVVLKTFGQKVSSGLLSFPRPGITLALDFPNSGQKLFSLMNEWDKIVLNAGGALYPAKDARMSGAVFRKSFPNLEKFKPFIDPAFSSSFWRRVNS